MGEPDYHDYDDDGECWVCGGEGYLDGYCVCESFEDTCCCLEPEPPRCDQCNGTGVLRRTPDDTP